MARGESEVGISMDFSHGTKSNNVQTERFRYIQHSGQTVIVNRSNRNVSVQALHEVLIACVDFTIALVPTMLRLKDSRRAVPGFGRLRDA